MPIDEQTRSFIETSTARPSAPPGSVPLEDFRAAVEGFRALGFVREPVRAVQEVAIPVGDGTTVTARVYLPDVAGPTPVVVWAHGGSWVRVTVDLLDNHFRVYANRSGCAVVAVDYGLAPEHRFPRALEEVHAAARWVAEDAAGFGWSRDRIGIAGESSGGNLAAVVAQLDRDRREVGFAHQALIVPVLDARFATRSWEELGSGYLLTKAQLAWALEQYAPGVPPTDPRISPVLADDLSGLPPTLVVTGEYDPLRDEGLLYAQQLSAAGTAVTHDRRPGLIHHALMVPSSIDLGAAVLEATAREIGTALRTGPPVAAEALSR